MTTFTAGEVRELVGTEDIIARARVDKMLRAYADLLEAREKAQPVAFRYQAQQVATGAWVWSGWLDLGDPGIASLHVHCKTVDSTKIEIEYAYAYAPPSDTERLAEALRAKIRRLRNMPNGEFQLAASIFADDLERILAAHSAQAQPPAANVPNGLIDALRHQLQIDECGDEVGVSRQAVDEAIAILTMLAALENPNG